ncbi:MAG: lysophospholipase [Bacteroidota bacterium]|nr:lysophospholipase [Bacteroidota bacterium]
MDFNIRLSNKQILKGFIKSPGNQVRAILILVHGLGEHIQRYTGWAEMFGREGIGFTGVDLPGHGASDGKRGHIKNHGVTDEMIEIIISECRKTFPGTPLFIYGHSLGGGIVLDYLIRKNPNVKGAIVTSPWLRLSFEPDKSKVKLAGMIKHIFPGLVQPSGLVVEHISHVPEVVEKYKNDPLVHDRISVNLFYNAMMSGKNTIKNASNLKTPLLLIHGSDDKICSPEGSREFASKTPLAEFRLWENGYHELHNESFSKEVFVYILDWINRRLAN